MIKQSINFMLKQLGYQCSRIDTLSDADERIVRLARPYTLTSDARLRACISSVHYVVRKRIPGAFVECGVWRGGSTLAALATLVHDNDLSRDVYLFDTFSGMTAPTERDRDNKGVPAQQYLDQTPQQTGIWCYASLEEVKRNLSQVPYPAERIHYQVGPVEVTIPCPELKQIAVLRLDTDWYESTAHELKHLFPLLSVGGILIVDDYRDWQGSRQATDEFLARHGEFSDYLYRIDASAVMLVKCPVPQAVDPARNGQTSAT